MKIFHVYPKDLANFLIPIPPLEIQRENRPHLDKINTLTTSISERLPPREIELRKKPYAYYEVSAYLQRGKWKSKKK